MSAPRVPGHVLAGIEVSTREVVHKGYTLPIRRHVGRCSCSWASPPMRRRSEALAELRKHKEGQLAGARRARNLARDAERLVAGVLLVLAFVLVQVAT